MSHRLDLDDVKPAPEVCEREIRSLALVINREGHVFAVSLLIARSDRPREQLQALIGGDWRPSSIDQPWSVGDDPLEHILGPTLLKHVVKHPDRPDALVCALGVRSHLSNPRLREQIQQGVCTAILAEREDDVNETIHILPVTELVFGGKAADLLSQVQG